MRFSFLSPVLLSALEALAGPAVRKAAFADHAWERRWLAPRDASLKLHIALRQHDSGAEVERQLLAVSDPASPRFRQHLQADLVPYLSTPSQGSVHAVESWLWQHRLLHNTTLFGGILEVETTIRGAERLLNTTYFIYSDGTRDVIRTELYHLPDTVAPYIDFVTPTTSFPKSAVLRRASPAAQDRSNAQRRIARQSLDRRVSCGASDYATPTCIRQAYGIDYNGEPNRTTFAIYATEGASFHTSDLQTYLERYNPPAAAAGAQYEVVGNGDPKEKGGIEARFETALDTQTAMGLAWPAKGILYNAGGVFGPNSGQIYDPFVQFLQELIANKSVPSVVSFSESMPEDQMDPTYARRLCNMMAQVATRGITLLFSSGDNGPNGDQPSGTHIAIFEPEFPAGCPWVTAVGGTTDLAQETAATKSTINIVSRLSYTASGGGFSNLFSTPSYQAHDVTTYVDTHVPGSYYSVPGFNHNGRGIPDISAFSTAFPAVVDDISFPVSGTSASTPLWAAIVALLNDYEASYGRPQLGFLNPWLYQLRAGLKDITTGGDNAGSCNRLAGCRLPKTLGFNVTKGWDPVTGLGSPVFADLIQALDETAVSIRRQEMDL